MTKRIAIVSAILEKPAENQNEFNNIVAEYKDMVRGRMGLPFDHDGIAVIALTVVGPMDKINALTGKLGRLANVQIKTAISQKELS